MMKAGTKTRNVSQELGVPMRTLQCWKKASIKSGNWQGPVETVAWPGQLLARLSLGQAPRTAKCQSQVGSLPDSLWPPEADPSASSNLPEDHQGVHPEGAQHPEQARRQEALLSAAQKAHRLSWANRHCRWSRVKWALLLWLDKTHI